MLLQNQRWSNVSIASSASYLPMVQRSAKTKLFYLMTEVLVFEPLAEVDTWKGTACCSLSCCTRNYFFFLISVFLIFTVFY